MATTSQTDAQSNAFHREELKGRIRMRGKSMAALSREHGYCDDAVRIALTRPWPAVERIIAHHLGCEPQDLWPDRYSDGKPKRGGRPKRRGGKRGHLRRIK